MCRLLKENKVQCSLSMTHELIKFKSHYKLIASRKPGCNKYLQEVTDMVL